MAFYTTTITTTDATEICQVDKPHNADFWFATIAVSGTFGGGTVTLQVSFDNGTTKIPLEDQTGSAWSATANRVTNIQLGDNNKLSPMPRLYATNSAVGSIVVTVADNVG